MTAEAGLRIRGRVAGLLTVAAVTLAMLTAVAMWLLWPSGRVGGDLLERVGVARETYQAMVVAAAREDCPGAGSAATVRCLRVEFRLLEGPDVGGRVTAHLPQGPSMPDLRSGDRVVLARQAQSPPQFRYSYLDRDRKPPLLWLAGLFALSVVILGRLRGLAALAGLVATFVVLLEFVLPAILEGASPVVVSLVGAAAIAFLALYLAHGFTTMTTVALIGTLGSLLLTGLLAAVFVALSRFTGFATEEAFLVNLGAARVDIAGLILGGIVIGALGAIDDMTVTQASAVWELRSADPAMPTGSLFRSGLRIGRDHVASTVNTLVLAYAGASLPLLLLFVLSAQPLVDVANSEVVATEIVRTLVGSIGLVAAVPLTTGVAALVASAQAGETASDRDDEPPPERGEEFWIPEHRRETWRS